MPMTTLFRHGVRCAVLLAMVANASAARCLDGGTDQTLNIALATPGAQVTLCPGAVFALSAPVVLKEGQRLGTAPGAAGRVRPATLRVIGRGLANAVHSRASNVRLHHLVIDGQRRVLGRIDQGEALIELGGSGARHVRVDHVRALDPRGWSTLHAFEGDKTCRDVVIEDNHFGPAGRPGGEWADGISMACRDSTLRRNLIEDATDGAIVVFGAPGSLIEDNDIVTRQAVLLGGINLVDYGPYDGDYTGTRVRRNRIRGEGGFVKVGIAIGPSVWSDDNRRSIRGVSVTDNVISGRHVGYGIAADGAEDVTIARNRVLSAFNGRIGAGCGTRPELPPGNQAANPARVSGTRDPGMAEGPVRYAICMDPGGR